MKQLMLLLIVFFVVAVTLVWVMGDTLRQQGAPRVAEAQARIAEAQARVAEAQAQASTENLEETYAYLQPVTMVCLTLMTVIVTFGLMIIGARAIALWFTGS